MINALPFLLIAAMGGISGSNTAYSSAAPVKVAACDVQNSYDNVGSPQAPIAIPGPSILSIRFANTAPKAASMVTFAVSDDLGNSYEIKDVGTFSTGVTINHEFESPADAADAKCTVQSVMFEDGSAWKAE
jgi:hypothetical protein